MPPASDSSVLSVSSCRTSRQRPAPSARAHGQLAIAAQHARQREVGDVRAREQQHQAGRAEQDQQHLARARRQLLEHVRGPRLEAECRAIDLRKVLRPALRDRGDLGRRRLAARRRA